MRWPALRFERFFERHLCRKAIAQLTHERDLMITAIAANPTWDEKDNREARDERLRNINESLKEGIEFLHSGAKRKRSSADEQMESDPLFRPLRNRAFDLGQQVSRPVAPEEGMGAQLIGADGG